MIADKIAKFHELLATETFNKKSAHEFEIKQLYNELLVQLANNHSNYRENIGFFLSTLEKFNTHSVAYSITIFFELFNKITKIKEYTSFDDSLINGNFRDETADKMKLIFEQSFAKNNRQRISEDNFVLSELTVIDKNEMSSLIISKILTDAESLNWSGEQITDAMMLLGLLRQLLNSIDDSELFYYVTGLLFDRLSTSEYYQTGRDLAEEIIICAYKDNLVELGFLNTFRFYSTTSSIHASLFYANITLSYALQNRASYSDKFAKDIIWQALKLFRNSNLMPFAEQIYSEVPKDLFEGYERRSLDHSYFLSLLLMQDPKLPAIIFDYLNKEKEKILAYGLNEVQPWLVTLYGLRKVYPNEDFSTSGFGSLLMLFEMIVPAKNVKKLKDIAIGNAEDLKIHLKESLTKLRQTRNLSDFVYDNESALKISSRLIEQSVINKDAASFLLSMMLKSDYTLLFQPTKAEELAAVNLPKIDIENFDSIYDNKDQFISSLPLDDQSSLIWLASSEKKIYELQLSHREYSFSHLTDWDNAKMKKLFDEDYFANLRFSDTKKGRDGKPRSIFLEEYIDEEKQIALKINFAKCSINDNASQVCVVKDMRLSKFPHNLLLNAKGEFIAKDKSISNILSTERILQTKSHNHLQQTYSKSIWIPTESQDWTLNYLYSNIEDTINENSFQIFQQSELPSPLSGDINIICSHGAKNISETHVIFQNGFPTFDLDQIIGKGKILIFFVCYSGSMTTEFFRNNTTSMIKRFIAKGYETVIAPFWALDARIPGYWLPEFLQSLNSGDNISKAAFKASKKVYEVFPTPAAWACLHLYGNPNLRLLSGDIYSF